MKHSLIVLALSYRLIYSTQRHSRFRITHSQAQSRQRKTGNMNANQAYQAENFTNTVEKFDMRMNLYPVDWLVLAIVQISSRHDDLPLIYQFYQGQSSSHQKMANPGRVTAKDIFAMVSASARSDGDGNSSETPVSAKHTLYSPSLSPTHALPVASNPRTGTLRAILNDPDRFKVKLTQVSVSTPISSAKLHCSNTPLYVPYAIAKMQQLKQVWT